MNSCPPGIRRLSACAISTISRAGASSSEATLNLRDPAADVLEGIWNEEWQKNIVDVALERVRRQSNPEHDQIYHLHAVKASLAIYPARATQRILLA